VDYTLIDITITNWNTPNSKVVVTNVSQGSIPDEEVLREAKKVNGRFFIEEDDDNQGTSR